MTYNCATPESPTASASPVLRFWRKSRRAKLEGLRYHFKVDVWNRVLGWVPLPVRLPWGAWWLATDDVLNNGVFAGIMQGPLDLFLSRVLKPGMTAVDVGAHHGFYTLLMSKLVGPRGRVIAFEPSPREFRRLRFHLKINGSSNVQPNQLAVANFAGNAEFFLVKGTWTSRNSLCAPAIHESDRISVPVTTLDSSLRSQQSAVPDLIKLDAEGAELQILEGATEMLSVSRRPLILCELDDEVISWGQWQHSAESIVRFLGSRSFRWFSISPDGSLEPLCKNGTYRGDYVAVPLERLEDHRGPYGRERQDAKNG